MPAHTLPVQKKPKMRTLISRRRIATRIRNLAREIEHDYKGRRIHLIGVLKGACIFLSDLVRELNGPVSIDFMAVASYGKSKESSGQVRLLKDLDSSIEGRDIILVEDILDTGLTLDYLCRVLRQRRPNTLKIAVLLDKPSRRQVEGIQADYVGFEIPNEFVVGYGLDFGEMYRNLRDVCVLSSPVEH